MTERIVAAAVLAYDLIFSLPAPARHGHVLKNMNLAGLDAIAPGPDAKGFVTSEGRFVIREEGAQIAIEAGQIEKLNWPPDLFSEDLW